MHRWKGRTWTGICLNCCSSCSSASFLLHSQSTTVFYYKWGQKILRFLGGFGLWHRTLNILQVIYWLRRENVKWKELICILQNMSNIKERQNTWEKITCSCHISKSYLNCIAHKYHSMHLQGKKKPGKPTQQCTGNNNKSNCRKAHKKWKPFKGDVDLIFRTAKCMHIFATSVSIYFYFSRNQEFLN